VPESSSFELTTEDVSDAIRIVALRGDADRYRAEAVRRTIQGARADRRAVVVDMAETTFMDSSMLATLVAASDDSRRRGGQLVLVVQTPRLRRSLEVKGLSGILAVASSRTEALELLAAEGGESPGESVPEPA
jgi:anti-sigma B factor antagonist